MARPTKGVSKVSLKNDPRFLGVADVKAVRKNNSFLLANVGFMSAGSYSDPVSMVGVGVTSFHELWCKVTGVSGRGYAQRLNLQKTGLTSKRSQALRAELDALHASGHAAQGGSAVHAASELGTGNDGVTGYLAGLSASIIVASESRSLQGTYAALFLQTEFKADNTMPAATTSFIYVNDASTVKSPLYLNFAGLTSGASNAWDATHTTPATCVGYLRVQSPLGVKGIPIYTIA